jgi:hypothetical protein
MAKRFLVLIALLSLGFFIAGCAEGDKASNVANPNPDVFSPMGSISGTVFDICKMAPVQGAIVSVGYSGRVHSVTTGKNGGFSFANVPANGGWYGPGAMMLDYIGEYYEVVCDLSNVKSTAGAAIYGYSTIMPAYVTYSDLEDGDNTEQEYEEFTESGSGASTPVNGLAANVFFSVAQPNATIKVSLTDVTAVEAGTAITGTPIAATSVLLNKRLWIDRDSSDHGPSSGGEYIDELVGAFTADATVGSYTIANVVPIGYSGMQVYETEYYVQVVKAGYSPTCKGYDYDCIGKALRCQPGCGQTVSKTIRLVVDTDKDDMIPYITTIDVGTKTDVISGDVKADWTVADVTRFVVHFNEAMKPDRTTKNNAVYLESHGFTVTVTSGGAQPAGVTAPSSVLSGQDIIKDFALLWTTSGTASNLNVIPVYNTAADWATAAGYGPTATFVINTTIGGRFHLELYPVNPHLTDANLVPWVPWTENGLFEGFLMVEGASDYQSDYILIAEDLNNPLSEEWYLWFGIGEGQYANAMFANYGFFYDSSCDD